MVIRRQGSYRSGARAGAAKLIHCWMRSDGLLRGSMYSSMARCKFRRLLPARHVTLDAMKADPALLQAALVGYESKLAQINEAISEIRRELRQAHGATPGATPSVSTAATATAPRRARRKLSAAARARIAAAQKKRWTEYKKNKK